jgi:hypothetical protein
MQGKAILHPPGELVTNATKYMSKVGNNAFYIKNVKGNKILLSSASKGGFKHFWWNPLSQAPSQRMISFFNVTCFEPHIAQKICKMKQNISALK